MLRWFIYWGNWFFFLQTVAYPRVARSPHQGLGGPGFGSSQSNANAGSQTSSQNYGGGPGFGGQGYGPGFGGHGFGGGPGFGGPGKPQIICFLWISKKFQSLKYSENFYPKRESILLQMFGFSFMPKLRLFYFKWHFNILSVIFNCMKDSLKIQFKIFFLFIWNATLIKIYCIRKIRFRRWLRIPKQPIQCSIIIINIKPRRFRRR